MVEYLLVKNMKTMEIGISQAKDREAESSSHIPHNKISKSVEDLC